MGSKQPFIAILTSVIKVFACSEDCSEKNSIYCLLNIFFITLSASLTLTEVENLKYNQYKKAKKIFFNMIMISKKKKTNHK